VVLFQLQLDKHPSPPGPVVVWMKISPQESSIKFENQKWLLEGVVLRRESGSVNTARSKTLTMGQIVKYAVFRCDDPGSLEEPIIVSHL
jgi:hypothetical protein